MGTLVELRMRGGEAVYGVVKWRGQPHDWDEEEAAGVELEEEMAGASNGWHLGTQGLESVAKNYPMKNVLSINLNSHLCETGTLLCLSCFRLWNFRKKLMHYLKPKLELKVFAIESGTQYFESPDRKAIFVPFTHIAADSRFSPNANAALVDQGCYSVLS